MSDWPTKFCDDCIFAIPLKESARKECRRFPPSWAMYSGGPASVYPPLQTWTRACAEFSGVAPRAVLEGYDLRPGAINRSDR